MAIYLDHNATTPLRPEVFDAIVPFLREQFGNPSSVHSVGSKARCAVEGARRELAAILGVAASEVVFTSGGTESNNLALIGAAHGAKLRRVLVGATEHSSVLAAADLLRAQGLAVDTVPVNQEGLVSLEAIDEALRREPAVVSVGWANNEIGTIQPIGQLSTLCAQHGSVLHVDAVQAFGKVPVRASGVHLLSISAHKIGGPKGVGALCLQGDVPLSPLLVGGGQERGRRAGTENVAAIVGMAAAAVRAHAELDWYGEATLALRDRLWLGLRTRVAGIHRHGPTHGLPNTLNVRFDGVRGEALVAALDLEGVAVSSGSACAAGAGEPSHVLKALGLDDDRARDGVRYSVGRVNTPEEIDLVLDATERAVTRIRRAHTEPR